MANQSASINPVPNYNPLGLVVNYSSATNLIVTAGQCWDSTNRFNITLSTNITINATINGLSGLDKGSLVANTFYYAYILASSIHNNRPVAAILSSSKLVPSYIPAGYDLIKLIGIAKTDGSANFLNYYISNSSDTRLFYWDLPLSVLSAGNATSLTAISLAAAVPPIDMTSVLINVNYTPNAAGQRTSIAPGGSTSTSNPFLCGVQTSLANASEFLVAAPLINGVPTIQYINSAAGASTSISVVAFEFNV